MVKRKPKRSVAKTNTIKRSGMKMSKNKMSCCSGYGEKCGGGYTLGFIGALVYYISTASTFWVGVLGVIKAMLWPGFLVYELFKFVGA